MSVGEQPPIVLDELERWVELHELWLTSREQQGRRLVLRDVVVQGASLVGRRLSRSELVGVTIDGGSLAQSQVGGSTLERVRIVGCDLTETLMSSCRITDTVIEKCKCNAIVMGGVEAARLELRDSDFSGSNLAKAVVRRTSARSISFAGANLLKAVFEDSDLGECNFAEADLMKVHVYRSDLRGSSFADANVHKMILVDVKMAGCRGVPREYGTMSIEDVDLSEAGDGSDRLGREMVETLIARMRAAANGN